MEEFDNEELLALARRDIELDSYESALSKLKKLLAESSPLPEAIAMAARLYAQIGLSSKAQSLFKQFLAIKPDAETEIFQLGMTHFEAGEPAKAITIWDSILLKNSSHPPALFYKALASVRIDKIQQAKDLLNILLQSIPSDNLYFQRGKELFSELTTRNFTTENNSVINNDITNTYIQNTKTYGTEH